MTDTDKELLEDAARAAGIDGKFLDDASGGAIVYPVYGQYITDQPGIAFWRPLSDDGDAFRLAVKCRMELDLCEGRIAARTPEGIKVLQDVKDCRELATRRAIVRAAAAIGKQ